MSGEPRRSLEKMAPAGSELRERQTLMPEAGRPGQVPGRLVGMGRIRFGYFHTEKFVVKCAEACDPDKREA